MLVIGLTGPSGSGKGALGKAFAKRGVPSLDTDAVYHELVDRPTACVKELAKAFGDFILDENGALCRAALASYVFCGTDEQKDRLTVLNTITHKYVLDACRAWLDAQKKKGYKAAIIDAPLLYESGFDQECDTVIAVLAPTEVRLARIMLRDSLSAEKARARILAQPNDDFYRSRADFIVSNDKDTAFLDEEAKNIAEKLRIEKT